jgi:hypothetical protein
LSFVLKAYSIQATGADKNAKLQTKRNRQQLVSPSPPEAKECKKKVQKETPEL